MTATSAALLRLATLLLALGGTLCTVRHSSNAVQEQQNDGGCRH
jgi:hypothetical protein